MNIFENLRLQSIYLFDVVFVHLQTNLNTILLRVNQTQFCSPTVQYKQWLRIPQVLNIVRNYVLATMYIGFKRVRIEGLRILCQYGSVNIVSLSV